MSAEELFNILFIQITELNGKLNQYIDDLHKLNASSIDYIAMMSNIDIPSEDENNI